MASTKTDSLKLKRVNGYDIYFDPGNGHFFFTMKDGNAHPRVDFATLRAAEDAARGDKEPVKVIVVGQSRYQLPEVVEIIGFSGWNLVTKDRKRLSNYRVYAYDGALLEKLLAASDACAKAHQQWDWAADELERAGRKLGIDYEDNQYLTVDGEHKRAEGGILRVR